MKKYIWGGSILVVIATVAGVVFWLMSGNNGTITPVAVTKVTHGPAVLQFQSQYISFTYSSGYQAVKQTATGTSLEMDMLTADTIYQKHLAVAIFPLDGSGLDGFSPYIVRKVQPELYTRSELTVDGATAVIMAKKDNTERSVFITHGDKLANLAFTTEGTNDDLQSEVSSLLTTFHWK